MTAASLVLQPLIPLWLWATLAIVALLLFAFGLWRRARGTLWRGLLAAFLLLALAGPELQREERQALDDIVMLVEDRSPSQRIANRPEATSEAADGLAERLAALPGIDLRRVTLEGSGRRGTDLFATLRERLGEVDQQRLAGIAVVTDGRVHDAPPTPDWGVDAPFHVLLTGRPDEFDRRIVVEQAPTFGVVGEPVPVTLRIATTPEAAASAEPLPLTVERNGEPFTELVVPPGEPVSLDLQLENAGATVFEFQIPVADGELTALNNRQAITVNGIRDRLRVLLVSGQPYPGLRVWRNLLKSDPAVDLVHFTILRPPEKQDGTPIRELALIAFPSRELFEVKLGEFDLIIFDRYSRRGLLPLVYLDNVARYVEEGGALLDAAGPEFADPQSLYRTPLSRVLPGRPSGEVYERAFRPEVTELGGLHPVTSGLDAQNDTEEWGRWFRQIDVETDDAQVLMTGVADRPLLVLERVGQGRVAQLLSDHAWLWARGFDGGGPQATLLRRLVHWLMREPELEEEALRARAVGDGLLIERQSLHAEPVEVEVTAPSGATTTVLLEPTSEGLATATVEADEDGLYRVGDGKLLAFATPRPIAPVELADMTATEEVLAPFAAATGGAVHWLEERGQPDIRRVEAERRASGAGWIGFERNRAYAVLSLRQTPLVPAWLAALVLLAAAAAAWWREGRG
ncbi:MAG: hypothetical protein H6852_02735 [Geminicoccaceae bacterium]|nr:hypothetical protein [Geminicoccaceae bacterium]MCB9966539.1 hypothetical protein [Geminicoccaceae bacterium]HRY24433.1 hypothetical protein [Geminicoccaceae bacterium]